MRLGVLGGTFDPVHYGHLLLAEEARGQLGLDKVLFVPSGQPWRKAGREISPAAERLEMLRRATEDNAAFEVTDLEIERPGASYTADTLEELRRQNADADLVFIVGLDAYHDMPNWKDPERIVELAWIAIAARMVEAERPDGGRPLEDRIPALRERTLLIENPVIEISASDVRERVRQGLSIRYRVPPAVELYIHEQRLYRD